MGDTVWKSVNPQQNGVSLDGLILDVNAADLGDANTSYTYFLLGAAGFTGFTLDYVLTATTLTLEASNDTLDLVDVAPELIPTTNDRTFAGAGNWVGDGGGSVAVNGGKLDVTAVAAGSGAKLDGAHFNSGNGFWTLKQYVIVLTISSVSAGTVKVYAGDELVALSLGAATQTLTLQTHNRSLKSLRVVASDAAATFSIDNVSIKRRAAVWGDVSSSLLGAANVSSTGIKTIAPCDISRLRVKRVTTNATNACELRLTRMRQ